MEENIMAHVCCETTNLKAVHYAARIWDGISDIDIERLQNQRKRMNSYFSATKTSFRIIETEKNIKRNRIF